MSWPLVEAGYRVITRKPRKAALRNPGHMLSLPATVVDAGYGDCKVEQACKPEREMQCWQVSRHAPSHTASVVSCR